MGANGTMITIHVIHHTIQISHEFVEILRRHPEAVGSLIMASSVLQDMGDPSGMIFRHGEFNGLLMSAILIAGGGATTWVMHEVGNIIKATYFGIGPIINRTYHEIREVQPEIQLPQNVDALIDRVQHFSAATPHMISHLNLEGAGDEPWVSYYDFTSKLEGAGNEEPWVSYDEFTSKP